MMKFHQLIQNAYETFVGQLDHVNVILLHPRSRYRSVLVAQLINSPDIISFYYAMGPDDINVQAFISGMTHDLATQHPTFGRHVNLLPETVFDDFDTHADLILKTFAQDLAEVSSERFLFILDEYDRSDSADDVQYFIERLPEYMPANCRLVINSRTLPRIAWISLIAKNRAVLIEDDRLIREGFYDIENHQEPTLEVYALGPGFVTQQGAYIDAWEGHLPRLLFFFTLDRPVVTRSDICHAFWPELNAEQAVNVFHVTKRRLHKALGMDVLVHEDGYYRVNPEIPLHYDVLEFVQALVRGRNEQLPVDERIRAWQNAIDLYRGPFLQGHDEPWIRERRAHYRAGYVEALSCTAEIWERRDRPEHSLALYQRALAEDTRNEALHRQIMRLYARLGRRSEAAAQYQALVSELQQYQLQPETETQALYESIRG